MSLDPLYLVRRAQNLALFSEEFRHKYWQNSGWAFFHMFDAASANGIGHSGGYRGYQSDGEHDSPWMKYTTENANARNGEWCLFKLSANPSTRPTYSNSESVYMVVELSSGTSIIQDNGVGVLWTFSYDSSQDRFVAVSSIAWRDLDTNSDDIYTEATRIGRTEFDLVVGVRPRQFRQRMNVEIAPSYGTSESGRIDINYAHIAITNTTFLGPYIKTVDSTNPDRGEYVTLFPQPGMVLGDDEVADTFTATNGRRIKHRWSAYSKTRFNCEFVDREDAELVNLWWAEAQQVSLHRGGVREPIVGQGRLVSNTAPFDSRQGVQHDKFQGTIELEQEESN